MEPHVYAFGRFRIDLASRQLLRDGVRVPLPAKAYEALVLLIRHRDRVVTKDELMRALWPDAIVSDDSQTQLVSSLRRSLGDAGVIATIPRRGYRFIVPVTENPPPDWDQLRASAGMRSRVHKLRPVASRAAARRPEMGAAGAESRSAWLLLVITLAAIAAALLVIANWPSLLAR